MKNINGFSMIELLITLSIVAILTTIAYPSYQNHMNKVHRTEAQVALVNLAARMERYYLENNYSYAHATISKLDINKKIPNGFYELSIKATDNAYVLSATPVDKQAKNDAQCGTLTLDQLGRKDKTGQANLKECW